jgi:tetratricopeptide (TPR) repeat protein
VRRALGLGLLWAALTAAAPVPPAPPPPDLAGIVPLAAPGLDKPAVVVTLPPPPAPGEIPPLPPLALALPGADKPSAFAPTPRTLPCVGAWLGIASESLECGRARFVRGELDDAVRALEQAVKPTADPDVASEARYWLGETLWRLGRLEQADWLFRQVVREAPRQEWGVWALHSSGWSALRLGDVPRAREAFQALLSRPVPAPIDGWGRHGLGLAAYALGRYEEAHQAWAALAARFVPPALARDVALWYGETLGRVGQYAEARRELARFTEGAAHPLSASGFLRLGWWTLAGGRHAEAQAPLRTYLSGLPPGSAARERDWGDAGLALALLAGGDWHAARAAAAPLAARHSPLALPVRMRLVRAALESPLTADGDGVVQELLAGTLTPAERTWVLLLRGELARALGNRDEARTQFDLARGAEPDSALAWHATVRLAQTNSELGEFAQAVRDLAPVLRAPTAGALRATALLVLGEAAYRAGDHAVAADAFRRFLNEFREHPEAAVVRVALAFALLRQGRPDDARREFVEFARAAPDHAQSADALVLGADLAARAGDAGAALALLERVVGAYPAHPRADLARLNRAIVLLRAGRAADAEAAAREWLGRAAVPELRARAHATLGVALLAGDGAAQAAPEFGAARREGLGHVGAAGLGVVALLDGRWDDAARAFGEARGAADPAVVQAAEYGLAVAGFHRGRVREFKQPALAVLAEAGLAPAAEARRAALLYALTVVTLEERDWPGALGWARRLVDEAPRDAVADDALERVAAAAAAAGAWRVAHDATVHLRQAYPQSPFAEAAWLRLAESQIEIGRPEDARRTLERYLTAAPGEPRAGRAWITLARARDVGGDRAGALEAYAHAARASEPEAWSRSALLGHARLLAQEQRWEEARAALRRVLERSEGAEAAETALAIGETHTGGGDHLAAAEYYLSAAYLAPDAPGGWRGLLAAGGAFVALGQREAAATVYQKLLARTDLPPELAAAARQGLAALGR